ncbi:NIPSNAP family protein [Herbaspirillum autotrophicum]|uniref:NIPSNAP family protein n=1 Tax=Herbaspirillum autotrophicum TaxID=180195 RepID=UPI00067D4709|nr:NIPSNAP family protein [Herbaspirillum autotrophicum]
MNQPDSDDPFYELRFYRVASGRQRDMDARVRNDLRPLFGRHQVRPAAAWNVSFGSGAPLFVYLTPWHNMQQRTKSWAGFYADPGWAEARTRTNAGSELVESYDIWFLRAILDWNAGPSAVARTVSATPPATAEMMVRSIAVGQSAAARSEIIDTVIPLLQQGGAIVHGVFDVMSGCSLPAIVLFVDWADMAQRTAVLARLDDRIVTAHTSNGAPLLGRADHYLMQDFDINWNQED